MGTPGWWTHVSVSLRPVPFLYEAPHARRLHVRPSGISSAGSSSSDSGGGGGGGVAEGVATLTGARGRAGPAVWDVVVSFRRAGSEGASFFSIWGGRSVVLCLPVVQGAISRNSSKVKTRGLQHFQPVIARFGQFERLGRREDQVRTFLAFVEDGWARVVAARLFGVLDLLAASLVDTLGGHCGERCKRVFGWINKCRNCPNLRDAQVVSEIKDREAAWGGRYRGNVVSSTCAGKLREDSSSSGRGVAGQWSSGAPMTGNIFRVRVSTGLVFA